MPNLSDLDVGYIVAVIITLVVAITVHEFMHAWTAWMLGDDTARHLGRISLNPAVHFDPIGAFMFLMIALGFPGIAWGKPVPVNDFRLRPAGRLGRQGSMALVSLAGPLSNVVLGAIAAAIIRFSDEAGASLGELRQFLWIFMTLNFLLAAFNLIPLPPLDGSRILVAILPPFWRPVLAPLERYGIMVLLLLILVGGRLGASVITSISQPVVELLMRIFLGA